MVVELAIVEEDVGVVVPAVEVTLDRLDGLDDAVELFIPGENDKGGIGSRLAGVGLEASGDEDLVVLLAYFAVAKATLATSLETRGVC